MPNGLGISFAPGADDQQRQQQGGTAPSGVPPLQTAIRLLSLRLPRVGGANALAPGPLLQSAGGAGLQGALSGGAGGIGGGGPLTLEQLLLRLFGPGSALGRPGGPVSAPGGGFTGNAGGGQGFMGAPIYAPPPRIIPGGGTPQPEPPIDRTRPGTDAGTYQPGPYQPGPYQPGPSVPAPSLPTWPGPAEPPIDRTRPGTDAGTYQPGPYSRGRGPDLSDILSRYR